MRITFFQQKQLIKNAYANTYCFDLPPCEMKEKLMNMLTCHLLMVQNEDAKDKCRKLIFHLYENPSDDEIQSLYATESVIMTFAYAMLSFFDKLE